MSTMNYRLLELFQERVKLKKDICALKNCIDNVYASFFYQDGDNRQINWHASIKPTDIQPILEKYLLDIEIEIEVLSTSPHEPCHTIEITNTIYIQSGLNKRELNYPDTYMSMDKIKDILIQKTLNLTTAERESESPIYVNVPAYTNRDDIAYEFVLLGEDAGIAFYRCNSNG